ncbi:hypothetical protein [Xanthobacter agilis]|uniref:Uncharacterized protein n=1 Tax=Xanthobacter agilis TaxID=47492 RepID=A0ABU0LJ12_XANAG|nr:hypothetical protein [Xanthobacter agilis]MDQ0507132.1 hypothetical protein [Xanthobacter agilis]
MANPACPAPTISVSVFSTDISHTSLVLKDFQREPQGFMVNLSTALDHKKYDFLWQCFG